MTGAFGRIARAGQKAHVRKSRCRGLAAHSAVHAVCISAAHGGISVRAACTIATPPRALVSDASEVRRKLSSAVKLEKALRRCTPTSAAKCWSRHSLESPSGSGDRDGVRPLPGHRLRPPRLRRARTEPISSASDLEHAIAAEELLVHYQPTIRRFADGTCDISDPENSHAEVVDCETNVLEDEATLGVSQRRWMRRSPGFPDVVRRDCEPGAKDHRSLGQAPMRRARPPRPTGNLWKGLSDRSCATRSNSWHGERPMLAEEAPESHDAFSVVGQTCAIDDAQGKQ